MKIWKHELHTIGETEIEVPTPRKALHLNVQRGKVVLWSVVNEAGLTRKMRVLAIPTGGDVPFGAEHLGTILFNGGDLVIHYFEVPS